MYDLSKNIPKSNIFKILHSYRIYNTRFTDLPNSMHKNFEIFFEKYVEEKKEDSIKPF